MQIKFLKDYWIYILVVVFTACNVKPSVKPSSSGKTCEILVVTDKSIMEGNVGDTLREFFMQEQYGLNQSEPLFTLPYIPLSAYENTEMFQAHRNVIIIDINDTNKTRMDAYKDLFAKPQYVFSLKAKNKDEFFKLFKEKRELMLNAINEMERARINSAFQSTEEVQIRQTINKTYGFNMVFPKDFTISKKSGNFAWIRKEAKEFSQGVLIFIFPYTDKKDLENKRIVNLRDSITHQWISGPTEGSYMTTEKEILPPVSREINFNGLYAVETRGLWKLQGDFMGGPFINYIFVDEKNNRIIMLDGYLYSPKKPKRDLLKQIEAIIYTYKP